MSENLKIVVTAKRIKNKVVISIVLIVVMTFIKFLSNQFLIENNEWHEFIDYTKKRGVIHDSGNLERNLTDIEIEKQLSKAGWTLNDFKMFKSWYYVDTVVFSRKNFELLKVDNKRADNYLWIIMKSLVVYFFQNKYLWIITLISISILYFSQQRLNSIIYLLLLYSILVVIISGLSYIERFPPRRVMLPLIIIFSFFTILLSASISSFRLPQYTSKISIYMLVFTATLGFCILNNNKIKKMHNELENNLSFIKSNPGNIFISWGGSIPIEHLNVFEAQNELGKSKCLVLGFYQNSPAYYESLKKFAPEIDKKYNNDLTKTLIKDDRFLLVVPKDDSIKVPLFLDFAKRKNNLHAIPVVVHKNSFFKIIDFNESY
jgi:hypothetical protein